MRPFAGTPAARTNDTVIWSFNGQNCSFYNLNWINVRRSQKTACFALFRMFFTLGNTGCGRKNAPILEANNFKTKEDMANVFLFLKSTQNAVFHHRVLNNTSP
jgi:hypothetical protein